MMYGHEKSRSAIVAGKPTNKAERSAAELVERRAETKGNAGQQRTRRAQYRISVSKMLARIRQHIFAVDTQGGNRMRESCTYGSVRGALSNERPYRDRREFITLLGGAAVVWAQLYARYRKYCGPAVSRLMSPNRRNDPKMTLRIKRPVRAHSMISSARSRIASGSESPRSRAVRWFTTRVNWVGCSTGRSAGFAPLI